MRVLCLAIVVAAVVVSNARGPPCAADNSCDAQCALVMERAAKFQCDLTAPTATAQCLGVENQFAALGCVITTTTTTTTTPPPPPCGSTSNGDNCVTDTSNYVCTASAVGGSCPTGDKCCSAPFWPCISTIPGRQCRDAAECVGTFQSGGRVLVDATCGDSPASFVCCQQEPTAPACSGAGLSCKSVTECQQAGGTQDNTKFCGDGPETCCVSAPCGSTSNGDNCVTDTSNYVCTASAVGGSCPTGDKCCRAPFWPCISTIPGRQCRDAAECEGTFQSGGRVLVDATCGDSPASFVCCQQEPTAPACSGAGLSCKSVTECQQAGGTQDNTKFCGDGPEICCAA